MFPYYTEHQHGTQEHKHTYVTILHLCIHMGDVGLQSQCAYTWGRLVYSLSVHTHGGRWFTVSVCIHMGDVGLQSQCAYTWGTLVYSLSVHTHGGRWFTVSVCIHMGDVGL